MRGGEDIRRFVNVLLAVAFALAMAAEFVGADMSRAQFFAVLAMGNAIMARL